MAQQAKSQPQTSAELTLRNPSPYPRDGIVITPWLPIAQKLGDPPNVRVYRDYGNDTRVELIAQIDHIDPDDPSRDQLVFALDSPLRPGRHDYRSVCGMAVVEPWNGPAAPAAAFADRTFNGITMHSGRLAAWVNTSSHHDAPNNHWFGGAVTSVWLDGRELLDAIANDADLEADPDKRAMQIDRIHLVRPPWDEDGSFDADVFNTHWRCIAASNGPLRATATIVSTPFEFHCLDVDLHPRKFECTVHRAISIFAGRDYIAERIWVRADADGETPAVDVWFTARYFMLVNLYVEPIVFRYPDHPGWFALVAPNRPRHGYAFVTDAQAGPIWHPPLEHRDEETRHRAYAWEIGATRMAGAAHIFRRDTNPKDLSDAAGWTWYDLVYKPLQARL